MSRSIVVADAGPIHYLVLIDCADTLEKLFDHILAPFAVREELLHPSAPKKVKDWLVGTRPWFEFSSVERPQEIRGLHRGEAEALQLALQCKAAAVLLDDLDGRTAARRLGLTVIGTVAILERAAEKNLLDLSPTLSKLQKTNFFAPPELFEAALQRNRARRKA
jgi:predicted nucleic acid-binding protein